MTPMMQQYTQIKGRNPGSILFFRLGDFYEMFGEDALIASKELDLALTTRDRAADEAERIPMCGVPYHSAQTYIARLINKGYKVAICEQLQDPATVKGLVDRDVVRMITPGTLMESSMLNEEQPNYLCSVYLSEDGSAICFADITTGEISTTDFPDSDMQKIENELVTYMPSEAIIAGDADAAAQLEAYLKAASNCLINIYKPEDSEQIQVSSLIGTETTAASARAVNILTDYLAKTQKTDISHFQTLRYNNEAAYMEMDISTLRNLELVCSSRTFEKKGSLLWVLDKTKTPMGRRLIRSWVLHPLLSVSAIKYRLSAVSELAADTVSRSEITGTLRRICDIERLVGKISFGNANCRDMRALADSIKLMPSIIPYISKMESGALRECAAIDLLEDIATRIDVMITENPPFSVREGGFIRDGADTEVDRLRFLLANSTQELARIEAYERQRTGKKMKVKYNNVFGYFIEIPRSSSDDVPEDYIRKQTLVNSERFITQELKTLETELLSAKDNLAAREYKLYEQLREETAMQTARIQESARGIAQLDVFCSLAETAVRNNYCMPEIDISDTISITEGRHPMVELMQNDCLFVPNDTLLDCNKNRTLIITGPNMAGKSTYMRQSAMIVLMAQIGSFVPARSAQIGVTDRVFTRIGASDDLSAGKSTFMVEMTEVADILKRATKKSLLILDEIGRGTSTYDGMSIARAVLEYCCDKRKLGAKTMFATHYHELTELEDEIEGIRNYNICAKKRGDEIIFLRKIVPGSADDSYGIEVAGLAGVPGSIIKRAGEVLAALENDTGKSVRKTPAATSEHAQMSMLDIGLYDIASILRDTDLNTITPLEALNLLNNLKKKL